MIIGTKIKDLQLEPLSGNKYDLYFVHENTWTDKSTQKILL